MDLLIIFSINQLVVLIFTPVRYVLYLLQVFSLQKYNQCHQATCGNRLVIVSNKATSSMLAQDYLYNCYFFTFQDYGCGSAKNAV